MVSSTFDRRPAILIAVGLGLALAAAAACGGETSEVALEVSDVSIEVTSAAFTNGSPIPTEHTCDGDDRSPPLSWSGVPSETRSIALISDDPDAPGRTWVHWVLYAIQSDVSELPAGVPGRDTLDSGARHGVNDFGRREYGGPCPPRGGPHRYFFKLYALDTEIGLGPGATKEALEQEMQGHILAQGELMGRYERK